MINFSKLFLCKAQADLILFLVETSNMPRIRDATIFVFSLMKVPNNMAKVFLPSSRIHVAITCNSNSNSSQYIHTLDSKISRFY